MNSPLDAARVRPAGRGAVTWYAYLLLGYFSYILSIQGNILPFLRDELDLTYREGSLHISAIAAGMMVVGLFGVTVIRALGRRRTLVVATLGSIAAAMLLILAPVAVVSIGACFLFGVLGAFIPGIGWALLSDVQGARRAIAFAEANAVACLFSMAAPLVTGACIWVGIGWRTAILVGAASGLCVLLAFHRTPIPHAAVSQATAAQRLPAAFWYYWVLIALGVAVEFSALLWAPSYLEQGLGVDPAAASFGATAFFVGMLIGRAGGSVLLRALSARRLFLAASAAVLAGFLAYRLGGDVSVALAGLFVVGLGTALLFPLALSFAIEAAGPAEELGSSRVMLAVGFAIMLAPPLLGSIADLVGLAQALLMMPVFMGLGLVAFFLGEAQRRSAAATPAP